MSEENVEVVREATDAFNRRELDTFGALLSPDVVWEVNPELPGLREVYRGRAEVRGLQEELLELGEGVHVELPRITELSDDRVFTETVITGRGKGSGVPIDLHYWTVLWVEEGKIARRQVWMERDEALEAAGLEE
jgi:ketosteroid isomerase-like protein